MWQKFIKTANKVMPIKKFPIALNLEKVYKSLINDIGIIIQRANKKYKISSALFPDEWKACSKNFMKKIT